MSTHQKVKEQIEQHERELSILNGAVSIYKRYDKNGCRIGEGCLLSLAKEIQQEVDKLNKLLGQSNDR